MHKNEDKKHLTWDSESFEFFKVRALYFMKDHKKYN